jgi:hypothetical protein
MKKRAKNNYIDKEAFHLALVKYKNGEGGRRVEDYVGKCILDICNNLAKKPCWAGYTYVDEMIEDGIENCTKAIRSYDVTKETKNPFWYFSFIANRAFIRRLESEKDQNALKHLNARYYHIQGSIDDWETNELSDNVIREFEERKNRQKEKARKQRKKNIANRSNN